MPLSVNIQEQKIVKRSLKCVYTEHESSTTIATIAFIGLEIKSDVIKSHKAQSRNVS